MDGWEVFVQLPQGRQYSHEGLRGSGLDNKPGAVLSHDGVFTGKFELTRYPDRLVSAVAKHFDVTFQVYGGLLW